MAESKEGSSVMSPQSLEFMRNNPPPSAYHVTTVINSVNQYQMTPPPPPTMSSVSQWYVPQWNQLSQVNTSGQGPLMRPTRPRRYNMPPLGPRCPWREAPYARSRYNRFNANGKNTPRFKKTRHKSNHHSVDASPSSTCVSQNSTPNGINIKTEGSSTEVQNIVKSITKKKRKSSSKFHPLKPWNRQDAEKALKVEMEAYRKQVKTLVIIFPDPDLTWDMIRSYHSAIEKVHFQVPRGPRYCFIQLSDESDVDQVINDLSKKEFYNLGKIIVKKRDKSDENVDPETIDPYTLYIGNLPLAINPTAIKDKFPTASRIDVGFSQKLKYTRYAFIRYQTVEESIEAFRSSHNAMMFDSQSLIVRFRRQRYTSTLEENLGGKFERKDEYNLSQSQSYIKEMKNTLKKKIKKEKAEEKDQDSEPTLNVIMGRDNTNDDLDSEEEEKEVDDDDDEDDDDDDDNDFDYYKAWKDQSNGQEDDLNEEDDEEDDEEEDDDELDEEDSNGESGSSKFGSGIENIEAILKQEK